MNKTWKKILAVVIVLIIVAGWYLTIFGAGPVQPIKDRIKLGLDIKGGVYVVMEAKTDLTGEELRKNMEQTQAVIEERVNQMGLAEPVVTIEGEKRIRVELPGAEDAQEAIEQIGKTAQLQFALADGTIVLDGGNVKDASVATDNESAGYAVAIEFDSKGADLFYDATTKAYNKQITSKVEGVPDDAIMILLDNQIVSAPSVNKGPISGGSCSITGNFTQEEASNLAALIRGGALPLTLEEVNSSVQSAKIGYDALEMSVYAGFIGLVLILIIMFVAYRGLGMAANLALLLYVVVVLNIMAAMGSVLTLPGIAGIILSVGMAVDANVIIFARIREEIAGGRTIAAATEKGFKRAMSTVIDSQVTTLIAAVILYEIGTSSVKGFAWTFMIGIVVGIFTAVVVTQLYVGLIANSRKFARRSFFGINKNNKATFDIKKELHFIKYRKVFYAISVIIIITGLAFGLIRGLNYGIDFTGGTMIQMDMGKTVKTAEVEKAIKEYNLDPEIIYSGENNEQIVIRTIKSLDSDQRAEVISTINKNFGTTEKDVVSEELFGPSIGKELRNNAFIAVILAGICMLIYIRFRFAQWKFGGAALLGVLHDVIIVIAFYAIFNITINNPFIAGILTVLGYSINDTIVVFDRIRENLKEKRSANLEHLIDQSITQTLGRSLMTSVTTLIVMIPLLIMAGEAIREFVFPLMVGIIAGAYSSIAVCSPLYYEFTKPEKLSKYEKQVLENMKNNKKSKKHEDKKLINNIERTDEKKTEENKETVKKTSKTIDQRRAKRYVKGNKK